MTKSSRTYRTRVTGRACENFGSVDYTITETLTPVDGGIRIDVVTRGQCEGERVDERDSRMWTAAQFAPRTTDQAMESARAYRLANDYVEI